MSGARAALPDRAGAIRRVLMGLFFANLAVVAVKVWIGVKAGSLSVLGDAIHSSVDALNNLAFIILTKLADAAPDRDHPYGHGKFEAVGALLILVFLSVTCFELLKSSLNGLLHPVAPPHLRTLDLGLLAGTLALNIVVTWYERRRGMALDSELLVADAAHTRVDVMISAGVLLGAVLMRLGVPHLDSTIAIIIVALVIRVGWQIIKEAIPTLVDQVALDAESIKRNAEAVDGVRAAYAIRSRSAAGVVFAELTIGVDGTLPVGAAHDIADAVEQRLKDHVHLDHVVVHIEPC